MTLLLSALVISFPMKNPNGIVRRWRITASVRARLFNYAAKRAIGRVVYVNVAKNGNSAVDIGFANVTMGHESYHARRHRRGQHAISSEHLGPLPNACARLADVDHHDIVAISLGSTSDGSMRWRPSASRRRIHVILCEPLDRLLERDKTTGGQQGPPVAYFRRASCEILMRGG
jgi:hypothetical protein